MEVVAYASIKRLTLNDNTVTAAIEIELERGLIDDLRDLKQRGQFRMTCEPFQKRLGEEVMKELRAFAEKHPYVRMEVPPGCLHDGERQGRYNDEEGEGYIFCVVCGQQLGVCPHPSTTKAEGEPELCRDCGKPMGPMDTPEETHADQQEAIARENLGEESPEEKAFVEGENATAADAADGNEEWEAEQRARAEELESRMEADAANDAGTVARGRGRPRRQPAAENVQE